MILEILLKYSKNKYKQFLVELIIIYMAIHSHIRNKYCMSIIINSNTLSTVIVAISFILLLDPTSMTMNVVATTNSANQGIGQSQSSLQLGVYVSGNGTLFSCNNVNSQNQANSGNNAAAQSGGNGNGGGNSATQGIGQSQSSHQNAQCVSGKDAIVSCDNESFQNQVNSGSNALAQQGGSGDSNDSGNSGGNSSD
jgi:hypothetical protein